jgi:nitrite reductase (NADH) large subunit
MKASTLAIIGNGMAANRVLELLSRRAHPFKQIHVLSDEGIQHYNRIMLSPLLAQETSLEAITPHSPDWYKEQGIQVHLDQGVTKIDLERQVLTLRDDSQLEYGALVLATGSRSSIPPLAGVDCSNVLGFRDMSDVDRMMEYIPNIQRATVIGAGLLGVEAAVGLRAQGLEVQLMHRNPVLMNRQIDSTASSILETELSARGIQVMTGVNPSGLTTSHSHSGNQSNSSGTASPKVTGVQYSKNGESAELSTDLVVFATGILPNKALASDAGLATNRGICVDKYMKSSHPDVYALGECCEFDGTTYGLVAPIWDQAEILVDQLSQWQPASNARLSHPEEAAPRADDSKPAYQERQHLTKLKVSGLDIHSIGQFNPDADSEVLELKALQDGIYKKLIIKNNKLQGILCIGDVQDSGWYFDLLTSSTEVESMRATLLMGKSYCQ